MGSECLYAELVSTMLTRPGVSWAPSADGKKNFGSNTLKTGGRIFAMHVDGRLVVKLPAHRVTELCEAGEGEPLNNGGKVMKEWLSLAPGSSSAWLALAEEALEFVRRAAA